MTWITRLLDYLRTGCAHQDRFRPRFDYASGKHVETCASCGRSLVADFQMDTRKYYTLQPRPEAPPMTEDVAVLLDRARKKP